MIIKAYGKINIALDVIGLRKDGYHLLKTIMQSIELHDIVNVTPNDNGINIDCTAKYVPNDNKNIAYKAAEIFIKTYNLKGGVDIHITKNIPVSAGLAGGSTDAAAVLKCMRKIYKPDITDKELINIGAKVGADVPFCIKGGTAVCEGIGEVITPIRSFKDKILILVKPNFGVSTKQVFKKIDDIKYYNHPNVDKLVEAINNRDYKFVNDNMANVLENVVLKEYPIIDKIKTQIMNLGALGCLMTGSGPTVFGFFKDNNSARICYNKLKKYYKQVFITRTI